MNHEAASKWRSEFANHLAIISAIYLLIYHSKAVPKGVAKRIATNSSSRKVFEAGKGPYLKALREAHHTEGDLKEAWDYANYVDPPPVDPQTNEADPDAINASTTTTPKKKKRKGRNFTFVIVPWSSSVVTNVIGLIKALVDKFPPGSTLRKLFNSKNVSYSYCVAKNMGHHIQGHNNKLLGRGRSKP